MTLEEIEVRRAELQRQLADLPGDESAEPVEEEIELSTETERDMPKLLADPMPSARGVSIQEWGFGKAGKAWMAWRERYREAWAERFELGYQLEEITPTDRTRRVPSRDAKWYRRELNGPWVAMSEDEVFYINPEQPVVPDTEFIPHYDVTRAKTYASLPYYCRLHGCLTENDGWPGPFHALPGTAGITNQLEASRLLEGVVHQGPNHHLYPGTRSIDRLVEFWKHFGIKVEVQDILNKLREQSGVALVARDRSRE